MMVVVEGTTVDDLAFVFYLFFLEEMHSTSAKSFPRVVIGSIVLKALFDLFLFFFGVHLAYGLYRIVFRSLYTPLVARAYSHCWT
jgi:hypothetical protein